MDVQQFPVGSLVDIVLSGLWVGPYTVTAQPGRTPGHLVLTGKSGTFEHCVDQFNIRPTISN